MSRKDPGFYVSVRIGSREVLDDGVLGNIKVSLGEEGMQRLIDQTHADVNAIRAARGLPPHDFSVSPPASRKGKRHLQKPTKAIESFLWREKDYTL